MAKGASSRPDEVQGRPALLSETLIMCAHITESVPNLTLAVPPELHRKMKAHPEIKWSEVVRRIIAQRIEDLETMDRIARRSRLTPRDVAELDHLVKDGLLKRYASAPRRAEG